MVQLVLNGRGTTSMLMAVLGRGKPGSRPGRHICVWGTKLPRSEEVLPGAYLDVEPPLYGIDRVVCNGGDQYVGGIAGIVCNGHILYVEGIAGVVSNGHILYVEGIAGVVCNGHILYVDGIVEVVWNARGRAA